MPFKDQVTSEPPSKPCESSGFGHDEIIGSDSSATRDGGIVFADEASGLMLCTEYLGFESYDMRMSNNEVENKMTYHAEVEAETERVEKKRKTKENVMAQERKREFPPPLSSLNYRGQRSFYLRPVRKDGRLELTQVMIDRPEIFFASREDGRLRLNFVDDNLMKDDCDPKEIVGLEDEPKGVDNENEDENTCRSGREINEDDGDAVSEQVVDLSMISGAKRWRCKSRHELLLNSNDDVTYFYDEHDAREWRYKNCYKIVARRNYDQKNDYHHHNHHHYHHHMHPYHHHTSNNNMHLSTGMYVKTR